MIENIKNIKENGKTYLYLRCCSSIIDELNLMDKFFRQLGYPKTIDFVRLKEISRNNIETYIREDVIEKIRPLMEKDWNEKYGNSHKKIRTFQTGATRDTEEGKIDPEGFLAPAVLEVYFNYMHKHRKQSDGNLRDSDNWQKGFGLNVCMKSMWRHLFDVWKEHRGLKSRDGIKDALCGVIFNAFAYLNELEKENKK